MEADPRMPLALILSDGRRVRIEGDIVIGRAPVAPDESPDALSVSLSDPTVSKSHALVGRSSAGVLWILDLHSSNGTEIIDAAGGRWAVDPGVRTPIARGGALRLGTDVNVTIEWPTVATDDETTVRRVLTDDRDAPASTNPASEPPPPAAIAPPPVQPPPPVVQSPAAAGPPPVGRPPPPTSHGAPPTTSFTAPPPPQPVLAASAPTMRSPAHLIGSVVLIVWGTIAGWRMLDIGPDPLSDVLGGWPARFFFAPDPDTLEFADFYSVAGFPGAISGVAHLFIGAVVVTALIALIVPHPAARIAAVLAAGIEVFLLFGLLVGFLVDDFDLSFLIRYDVPHLVVPVVGAGLLLWPTPSTAEPSAPPAVPGVTYASQPPHLAPGAPPFGGRP